MAVEGTLDTFRLSDILQVVSHQRKTGILTVQGAADIVAISFLRGQVVAADALSRTVEEGLGEVLVRQGLLTREQLEKVAARHQSGGGRLIDLLVDEEGAVGRNELLAALREQTQGLLLDLLGWRQGEFKFYSGDEVSYEEGFVPISIEELLLRHLELGGDDAATVPDDDAVYERVDPPPREVRERLGEPRPDEAGDEVLWLSREEIEVWEATARGETVAGLVVETGLDPYKVRFALHRLLRGGAVALAGAAAPAAAEPVPRPAPAVPIRPVADVVTPPAPAPAPVLAAPRRAAVPRVEQWAAALLGLALAAGVAVFLLRAPERLLFPFPWQAGEKAAQVEAEMAAGYLKIDRAATTFYLLSGRFPDRLDRLVEMRLLDAPDLDGPDGAPLAYAAREDGYSLRPAGDDAPGATSEQIGGNFLLDPNFLAAQPSSSEPPLVLLD